MDELPLSRGLITMPSHCQPLRPPRACSASVCPHARSCAHASAHSPRTMQLSIAFEGGTTVVTDGMELSKSQAAHAPAVRFRGTSGGKLHTLVMTDPDAPSPDHPVMAEWLHWLVVNVPAGGDVSAGDTLTPYAGPTPPRGAHRYFCQLYEQPDGVRLPRTPHIEQRGKFSVSQWTASHGLPATPVASVHFVCKAGH